MNSVEEAELKEMAGTWFNQDNLAYRSEDDLEIYLKNLKRWADLTPEEVRVVESEIYRLHNDLAPTPYDIHEAATALYAGGWKAADRDEIAGEYEVSREGVLDALCEQLAEIEKKEKEKGAGK